MGTWSLPLPEGESKFTCDTKSCGICILIDGKKLFKWNMYKLGVGREGSVFRTTLCHMV